MQGCRALPRRPAGLTHPHTEMLAWMRTCTLLTAADSPAASPTHTTCVRRHGRPSIHEFAHEHHATCTFSSFFSTHTPAPRTLRPSGRSPVAPPASSLQAAPWLPPRPPLSLPARLDRLPPAERTSNRNRRPRHAAAAAAVAAAALALLSRALLQVRDFMGAPADVSERARAAAIAARCAAPARPRRSGL